MRSSFARMGIFAGLLGLASTFVACGNAEQEAKDKAAAAQHVADSVAAVAEQQQMDVLNKEAEELDAEMDALEQEVNSLVKDI